MTTSANVQIIDRFRIGDQRFSLTHNYDDDSRSVLTGDGKTQLLQFDASCGVHQNGKKIGTLNDRDGKWTFIPFIETGGGNFITSQPIRDYHWLNLQRAEIEVAQHLLM